MYRENMADRQDKERAVRLLSYFCVHQDADIDILLTTENVKHVFEDDIELPSLYKFHLLPLNEIIWRK